MMLLATATQGLKLNNDIFDAYDQESAQEQKKNEDQIDPNALAAEIGGEDIARDVMTATGGIVNAQLLQFNDDDDELSDKQKKMLERVTNFRRFENNNEAEDAHNRKAFQGKVVDVSNTHSTYPRPLSANPDGTVDSETEPTLAQKFKGYRPPRQAEKR